MKLTPGGLLEHAKSDEGRKQLRYAAVVIFVPLGQVFVQLLKWVFDVFEVYAVLITACILTLPNYLANKHLVWRDKSKDNQATEVTVFWLAAVLGTGFAMAFVYVAGRMVPESKGELIHGASIFVAQLLGYGIVWVARYLFLDRLIFKATHHGEEPSAEVLEDLHREFPGVMDPVVRAAAEAARGFMPPDEGLALHEAGIAAGGRVPGAPFLEIGSYCGKSGIYLGAAAEAAGVVLFAVDHHRGSEENQAGWEWHEPDLVDPEIDRMDTLPRFRRTIFDAGLERSVVAVVADAPTLGRFWTTPLALLFIDGGHGAEPAHRDYETWTPFVAPGGLLAIHDVFPDPADGGRPPFEIYERALGSGNFAEITACGSLRVLERLATGGEHRPEPRYG